MNFFIPRSTINNILFIFYTIFRYVSYIFAMFIPFLGYDIIRTSIIITLSLISSHFYSTRSSVLFIFFEIFEFSQLRQAILSISKLTVCQRYQCYFMVSNIIRSGLPSLVLQETDNCEIFHISYYKKITRYIQLLGQDPHHKTSTRHVIVIVVATSLASLIFPSVRITFQSFFTNVSLIKCGNRIERILQNKSIIR